MQIVNTAEVAEVVEVVEVTDGVAIVEVSLYVENSRSARYLRSKMSRKVVRYSKADMGDKHP